MSGTTIRRRLDVENPRPRRQPRVYWSSILLGLGLVLALMLPAFTGSQSNASRPDLSISTADVTCDNAHSTAIAFRQAVDKTKQTPPNYDEVTTFGFEAPINPSDIKPLQLTLDARLATVDNKAKSQAEGKCTDSLTATITDADGKSKVLPVVDGDQPLIPISGSEANRDPRTVPVTVGTDGDKTRTDNWSELDKLYGDDKWYTDCSNTNVDMSWDSDVPKFVAAEGEHETRFIVAINVSDSITDDQIRKAAAEDGNPNTSKLEIVRTETIINTRNLGDNRCDPFIHTKSQIRVTLGKPIFDENGKFKELDKTQGIFADCHNMWRLPKSKPVPTTPAPTPSKKPTKPGATPSSTPPNTPPTTKPPAKCVPPEVENPNGNCVVPKKESEGDGRDPIDDGIKGTHPTPDKTTEPRPEDPPDTYTPPPPPANDGGGQTTQPTRTAVPEPEEPAPGTTDPAQSGGPCAPGIPSC